MYKLLYYNIRAVNFYHNLTIYPGAVILDASVNKQLVDAASGYGP